MGVGSLRPWVKLTSWFENGGTCGVVWKGEMGHGIAGSNQSLCCLLHGNRVEAGREDCKPRQGAWKRAGGGAVAALVV